MRQFFLGAVPASRRYPFVDLVWEWTLSSSPVPEGTTCVFLGKIIIRCLTWGAAESLTASPESSIHCRSTLHVSHGWRCQSPSLSIREVFLPEMGLKTDVMRNVSLSEQTHIASS